MQTVTDFCAELDKIQGWPVAMIVVAVCVIWGYILKVVKPFPNQGIPLAVILLGALLTILLAEAPKIDVPARIWVTRNLAIGLIFGFIAWLLHNMVLAKVEDWLSNRFKFVDNLLNPPKP